MERLGNPFGLTVADVRHQDEGVLDALMVCKAAEVVARVGLCLDARALVASVGPDPSAFVRRVHGRHAVSYNRPADRRGTIHGFSWGAGSAVIDCQVALGVSRIPTPVEGQPGGAYQIDKEPGFVEALFGGRTLEEIADLVSMSELRNGAKLVPWLRNEPGACDPEDDRDFWVGWPGNGPRLLKACRDLVSRRIGCRGGIEGGEPINVWEEAVSVEVNAQWERDEASAD